MTAWLTRVGLVAIQLLGLRVRNIREADHLSLVNVSHQKEHTIISVLQRDIPGRQIHHGTTFFSNQEQYLELADRNPEFKRSFGLVFIQATTGYLGTLSYSRQLD